MDENKRLKLVDIGYEIPHACGTCEHAHFRPGSDFGGCMLHKYDHRKHSDDEMDLSIYRFGVCGDYEESDNLLMLLGQWHEFVPGQA